MTASDSTPRQGQEGSGSIDPTRSYCELGEAVDALERVDFRDVPTISTSEAAALHARLREARDDMATSVSPAPGRGGAL